MHVFLTVVMFLQKKNINLFVYYEKHLYLWKKLKRVMIATSFTIIEVLHIIRVVVKSGCEEGSCN